MPATTTPYWAQNLPAGGPDGYGEFWDFTKASELESFDFTVVDATNVDATIALGDADYGTAVLTCGAADDDSIEAQQRSEGLSLNVLGRTLYVFGRMTLSDATQSDFIFGLASRDTTIITAVDNSVAFRKDDGDTQIDQNATASSATINSTANVATMSTSAKEYCIRVVTDANTLGTGTVTFYVDGTAVGTFTSASLPTTEMAISFGVKNGEAAAKVLTVDNVGYWITGGR